MSTHSIHSSRGAEGGRTKLSGESQGGSRLGEQDAGTGGAAAGDAAAEGGAVGERCVEAQSGQQERAAGRRSIGRHAEQEAARGGLRFVWGESDRSRPPVALILFAGDGKAAVTLASALRAQGWVVVCIDTEVGGEAHDLLIDEVAEEHLADIAAGVYDLVWLATPCESYTTRLCPPLRRWGDPWGKQAPAEKQQYLADQNRLAIFTAVAIGACPSFTLWALENPADVTTKGTDWFWSGLIRRCFLWHIPPVKEMLRYQRALVYTFAYCAFGAPWRKWTTVAGSSNWGSALEGLRKRVCIHGRNGHQQVLQGASAKEAAAYVPEQCRFFAEMASARVRELEVERSSAGRRGKQEAAGEATASGCGYRAEVGRSMEATEGASSWRQQADALRARVALYRA